MGEPQVETVAEQRRLPAVASAFSSIAAFENAQRMANALARSDLVPQQFRNSLANCLIALEMAQRIGASPLAVMQNLNVIHGRPSWGAQFVIAALNSCGLFSPLRFKVAGEGNAMKCHVEAVELATGEVLAGPTVSMAMAEREGWLNDKPRRDGQGSMTSKWKTMPDVMIRYRAATYFGRLYAPHVLMGMRTADELQDIPPDAADDTVVPVPASDDTVKASPTERLNDQIRGEGRRRRNKASDRPEASGNAPDTVQGAAGSDTPAGAAGNAPDTVQGGNGTDFF